MFWALENHYKDRNLNKFSAPQAIFFKKGQKSVFRHFLENFDQKIAFYRRALPPKF